MRKKNKENESMFIMALKFASGRGWFSLNELLAALNIETDSPEEAIIIQQIREKNLFFHAQTDFFINDRRDRKSLNITVEDEFRLLEYIELQEARASSISATRFASLALVVSIISTLASVGFSLYEILGR